MKFRKKVVAVWLTLGAVLSMAGTAVADHNGRADGVCGGYGGHYNPLTGECDFPL